MTSNQTTPDTLFRSVGGEDLAGFPAIHATAYTTGRGTAYLKGPGVVTLAKPSVALEGLRGFLVGFGKELGFEDYLSDQDQLAGGTQLCKVAGQTCYLSFGPKRTKNDGAAKYFENIKSSGHGSVLEHASFSFLIYGVSRSFTHELVRHRAGTAFSQTSQRFVDGKVLRFVERPEYQEHPELHERFEATIDQAAVEYATRTDTLLREQAGGARIMSAEAKVDMRKKVQQAARSCLPNETEAPIVFSANVRAMRHVIEMRANQHAETEIRQVFLRLFLCLARMEPVLFGDYQIQDLPDGTFGVTTAYRKV
jgi:thymidylate synthase (FAD)